MASREAAKPNVLPLEISIVAFRNVQTFMEGAVDVSVGIDGAFGRGRWFQGPVTVGGGFFPEEVDDGGCVGNARKGSLVGPQS